MFFSDTITLRAVTYTNDSYGDQQPSYVDTIVNADKRSVTRSEFYAATGAGVKVDIVFAVHVEDYSNQTAVTYASKSYKVIRAYQKGEGVVELMCAQREVS